jgi:hypothetical protein
VSSRLENELVRQHNLDQANERANDRAEQAVEHKRGERGMREELAVVD